MPIRATGTAPSVVASCDGGSPAARRAGAIAAELAARGVAKRASTELREPELRGRRLIALDGCASACCSRRLESLGLDVQVAVDLSTVAGDVPSAARLVRAAIGTPQREHRHRVGPPAEQAWTAPRPRSVDDYLLAIDALAAPVADCGALTPGAPTLAAHVSQLLGVTRPSAGEMLARLEADGLIGRSVRKEILLTPDGRAAADRIVRRHRVLECFAVELLGYPPQDAFAHARRLAGSFDDDAAERLAAALGSPGRCPHGWPLDAALARAESTHLQTLATLDPGEAAAVVCLDERDAGVLRSLAAYEIRPGATVTRARRAGPASIRVNGKQTRLPVEHQAHVLVRASAGTSAGHPR